MGDDVTLPFLQEMVMKKFMLVAAALVLSAQFAEAGCLGAAARAERQANRAERRIVGKGLVTKTATSTVTKAKTIVAAPFKFLGTCTNGSCR